MKKLVQIVAVVALSLGFVSMGHTVGAVNLDNEDQTCGSIVISNTGANSNNSGVCTVNLDVTVTCVNNVYVLDNNSQSAVSGAAQSLGNTTSGTATSGNAKNNNGTTVQIGAACGQQPAVVATPVAAQTPVTSTSVKATPAPQKVATLPFTSGNSMLGLALASIAVIAAALTAIRVAIVAYRRQTAK